MTTLESLLIGEGSVLVRCAEIVVAKGHRIKAVVSSDPTIRSWATKAGVHTYGLDEATGLGSQLDCDLLLSTGNHKVIPDALLTRAKRMSLNYHYGPLPEYSGLHAPSWAIFEGATEYAITWHRMGEFVDGGAILKRIPVPIDSSDTALSLGLKCDEAAVQSLAALIDEIAEGRETETPQDLAKRRYFSGQSQFPAEGLINWSHTAEQIMAQVHATDYGPFSSPLVWPKVLINGQIFAVRKASVGAAAPAAAPGEVVRHDASSLHVATATRSIRLTCLSSLEGEAVDMSAIADPNELKPGAHLASPGEDVRAQITSAGAAASKATPYWRGRLREYRPYRLPYPLPSSSREESHSTIVQKISVMPAENEDSFIEYVVGGWCTFLARVSGIAEAHVAIAAPRDAVIPAYRDLFSASVPLLAHAEPSAPVGQSLQAIIEELRNVRQRGFIRRDLIGRDEELSARFERGDLTPDVLICWGEPVDSSSSGDSPALQLVILPAAGTVEFHCNPRKISHENATRLAGQFSEWCRSLALIMSQPLQAASAVSEQERTALIEDFNATRNDTFLGGCVHQLIERAALLHKNGVALWCADDQVSYEQLNADANRLARVLRDKGVRRGDLVGVCLDRSIDLVVTLLGVLKTGAAYVPVDPAFPAGRIRGMLDEAKPCLLITPPGLPDPALDAWSDRCLSMDRIRSEFAVPDGGNLDVASSPDDLAYVIFTSGSTGKPKGVEVTHGSLSNFLLSMRERPGCTRADRLLAITTISFDIAALELFLPLLCGASVVIAQPHETVDGSALLALMLRHSVTMMQATPATWQLLLQSGWQGQPSLPKILCGGEALSPQLAGELLSCGKAVWNMYGPTETTVWSSIWKVRQDEDIVIGAPISNTQLYVLDANLLPVPVGFPGELYIGGAGVSRGYHKDPEQTRSQFLPNPFHSGQLYRTGDLACFREPGKLAVLGRNDGQIKLRGFRIELGDVEAAISSHPEISRAVVVGWNDRLVAYCLRDSKASVDAAHRPEIESSGVAEWTGAWDRAYETQADDLTLNISGWHNSYDGLAFSRDEMRDWQKNTVDRILSHSPQSVFEIGSGSGLILFDVAPHCTAYRAIDASKQAVELVQRGLQALPHVACEQSRADTLPDVPAGAFDTVIINSVAQYFPSLNYLMSVLEWATQAVTEGRIFIGDVRDLSLLHLFHADMVDYRSRGGISTDELRRRIDRSQQSERELVIAPEFFSNLPTLLPRICRVEIALRNGDYVNEMTRYRYDVTLHIGNGQTSKPAKLKTVDWHKDSLDLSMLRARLDTKREQQLCVLNVPNGRLADVHKRVAHVLDSKAQIPATERIDPRDLKRVASEAGYELALLPSRSRDVWMFDAVLWQSGRQPHLNWPAKPMDRNDLAQYANVPAIGVPTKPALSRLLRPWLEDRLPDYMTPAFFVEVDEFPLTPNGKIDRKALPEPTQAMTAPLVRPTNELEREILAIWSEVLGHDRIALEDSFFKIGGDSLRVVRVQAKLQQLLGRPISTAALYEHFTIKALAAHVAGNTKASTQRLPKVYTEKDDDIAIVSMNCRLPGGVNNPEDFWNLLERGGDGIIDVPKERWDAAALYDPDPDARGKAYCSKGGFVMPIDLFDATFFGISPREARALDPAQRMMLEVTWEAFERAGYSMEQLRGSQTAVYVGIGKGYHEYGLALAGGLADLDGYIGTGSAGSTMSGRLSYVFGLEGPSMTVDTACSSSLVTTHLACNALRRGECDIAVAAGITLMLSPDLHIEFSRLRGMSPDGRCKSFSSAADGTGWSEGAAVVVLKRLSDAKRDGDPILAVLRGTAVNHAGHSASLTTPSGPAQQRVIHEALDKSGLRPGEIDYLEAHGTGTKLGDPIEATSVAAIFGGSRSDEKCLWIGSVKSNLGHTQAAAGLAGVIKTVLAMQHNKLPRTLHAAEPSPAVDWASAQIALVQTEQPWLRNGRPRRAGVSSFGIGGTNAHVILEEPPAPVIAERKAEAAAVPPSLPFLVSGFSLPALRAQADKLHGHLGMNIEDRFLDIAHSLAATRTHFRKRLVLFAKNKAELLDSLASFARTGETPAGALRTPEDRADECRLALLFTGQGSQMLGMGRALYGADPLFRQALDEIAAHFTALERPLFDVMWAEPGTEDAALLHRTDFTQPALFALEVALWRVWESWGVKPDLLIGHSIGEFAAAHVAGVFDLADACRLVAARGRLMQALPKGGGMASLEAGGMEVEAALQLLGVTRSVSIAALNAPQQTVVAGDIETIEKVVTHFERQNRRAKRLEVSHAFHSHLMTPMLGEFRAVAEAVRYAPPRIVLVSSVTGALVEAGEITNPEYWVRQVREPVRFNAGMRALRKQGANTFLELGPQPVLSGLGAVCLPDDGPVSWLASLRRGKDDAAVMQSSLAELHILGAQLNWRGYFMPFGGERVALPTYTFQRERYWLEPMPKREVGAGLIDTRHQLLGGGANVAGTEMTLFTTVVSSSEPVWVQEHQVMDVVLMPGTAFFEAMRAAGKALDKGAWDVCDVIILAPMALHPDVPVRMQVTVGPMSENSRAVRIYSLPESNASDGSWPWQLHAEGKLVPAQVKDAAPVTVPPPGGERMDVTALYKELAELGYAYGPTFQGLREAWRVNDVVWAKAALAESAASSSIRYGLHPALLDSAMHSLLLTQRLRDQVSNDLYVPFEAERLSVWREGLAEIWVRVAEFEIGDGEFWASLDLYDAQGAGVGRLQRLHARHVDRSVLRRLAAAGVDRFQFEVTWQSVETNSSGGPGAVGLMVCGHAPWANDVRAHLSQAGVTVVELAHIREAESVDRVVCLWGAGADVIAGVHELSAMGLAQVHELASAAFELPVVWVTRGAVGAGSDERIADPGAGPLWGLIRTARNEHPELKLQLVDIGEDAGDLNVLAAALALEAEPECALRRGQVLVPRLERATAEGGLVLPAEKPWRLGIATKGRLDRPLSIENIADEPLAAGEIRASVKATGVNFLDVLNALGMVEIPALGFEYAGVVTDVGSGVKDLKAGDPVLGLARGSFASVVVADARQVVLMPGNLSFEEAATIPMAFLTAWYGLHDLGGMKAGERVLIHSAAGGVGMAAVQLAQLRGADVYGTASEPKWPALRKMGLADDHIGTSRSLEFVESFSKTSAGRSFDIVLNSLAREFVDASLAILRGGGRFLEMGKLDLREQSWVDEHHPGVTYRVYNLPEAGPDRIHGMLVSLAGLFAEGKLKPLPIRTFPVNRASDALRFMAQARHVGKVVLVPAQQRRLVQPDGAVLVTGGVGGLGRYVTRWLATQHGVKDFVLTSRRGLETPEAKAFVAELAEIGAAATVVACDAADAEALQTVMSMFTRERPLRGVVHAAGVLDDGVLTALTPDRLDTVLSPKADGAWNLHKLTQDLELDFFVLFSSISGVTGAPGQGNYAAANTFLDALAYHRRFRGLPATSIAWGAWDGQGMAARLSEADRTRFSRQGMDALTPAEGVEMFEAAVLKGGPLVVAGAFDLSRMQRSIKEHGAEVPALFRSVFNRLSNAQSQGTASGGANLRKLLSETTADRHEAVISEMLQAVVAKTLEFSSPEDVDVNLPLQDIGIDSLTAVLLRNQLSDMTGLALPAKIAFDHPHLRSLGQFLLVKMQESGLVGAEKSTPTPAIADVVVRRADVQTSKEVRGLKSGHLAPELLFGNAPTVVTRPEAVFLTGATGFVGAFLLHELLKANVAVYCLVRAHDAEHAMTRLVETLQDYDLWNPGYAPLLRPVVGDLAQPLFGMTNDEFNQLADQVDAICHSGALVDWMLPLDAYLGPNVVGTHEVIRLASRGRGKIVHFISTAVTLPKYLGYEVPEDDREYGYLTSKWMGEQMVAAARWRGAVASVYRLPFVGAAVLSGHYRLDKGDFLHNLIAGCMAMGCFPSLETSIGGVLPIDYLARVVAHVMTRDVNRIGKDYDFINPTAPPFNRFVQFIRAAGSRVDVVPFTEWQTKALEYARSHQTSSLARISAVVDGLTQKDLEFMFEGFPVGKNVFGGEVYPCPLVDEVSVQPYTDRISAVLSPWSSNTDQGRLWAEVA